MVGIAPLFLEILKVASLVGRAGCRRKRLPVLQDALAKSNVEMMTDHLKISAVSSATSKPCSQSLALSGFAPTFFHQHYYSTTRDWPGNGMAPMTQHSVSIVPIRSSRNGTRANGLLKLSSVHTVARKTSLSESHLRTLLRDGKVEGDKIGGLWITTVAAVRSYKQNHV